MQNTKRIRIAIQKRGRLYSDSINLLFSCGLKMDLSKHALYSHAENFPVDLLLVRSQDIPTLVMDDICDLGIVGQNVLFEKSLDKLCQDRLANFQVEKILGFGHCRLSIALPKESIFEGVGSLSGLRIATSYPNLLSHYLAKNKMKARILYLNGSVEIAPRLKMADAICDLVSTGRTLEENNLVEVDKVIDSQAVLIKNKRSFNTEKQSTYLSLLDRIKGALQARESKYIIFHAPKDSLNAIQKLLPGLESPTVIPLDPKGEKCVVQLVSAEGHFWSTLEKLKKAGASSILVLPIEKMMG